MLLFFESVMTKLEANWLGSIRPTLGLLGQVERRETATNRNPDQVGDTSTWYSSGVIQDREAEEREKDSSEKKQVTAG
jgi:hypothetical protein